jgi:hypothetical protein
MNNFTSKHLLGPIVCACPVQGRRTMLDGDDDDESRPWLSIASFVQSLRSVGAHS